MPSVYINMGSVVYELEQNRYTTVHTNGTMQSVVVKTLSATLQRGGGMIWELIFVKKTFWSSNVHYCTRALEKHQGIWSSFSLMKIHQHWAFLEKPKYQHIWAYFGESGGMGRVAALLLLIQKAKQKMLNWEWMVWRWWTLSWALECWEWSVVITALKTANIGTSSGQLLAKNNRVKP